MMKRNTFAALFSILLISACLFASCNANDPIFGNDTDTSTQATETATYSAMIRDLENRIVELQQTQYISDSERREELLRLQNLLAELKNSVNDTDGTTTDTDSSPEDTSTPSDETAPSTEAIFLYTTDGNNATITGYTGNDRQLTIPSVIDGYTVTAIADSAFSSDALQSVVIPESVTKIGWFAFSDCSALTAVTLPSSVASIGYSAFPKDLKGFTIYCHNESFAQRYAESYGLSYALI